MHYRILPVNCPQCGGNLPIWKYSGNVYEAEPSVYVCEYECSFCGGRITSSALPPEVDIKTQKVQQANMPDMYMDNPGVIQQVDMPDTYMNNAGMIQTADTFEMHVNKPNPNLHLYTPETYSNDAVEGFETEYKPETVAETENSVQTDDFSSETEQRPVITLGQLFESDLKKEDEEVNAVTVQDTTDDSEAVPENADTDKNPEVEDLKAGLVFPSKDRVSQKAGTQISPVTQSKPGTKVIPMPQTKTKVQPVIAQHENTNQIPVVYAKKNKVEERISSADATKEEKIERIAPLAALLPLVMAVIVSVVGKLLLRTVGSFYVGNIVCTVLITLFKVVFILAAAAAVVGTVYVAVKIRDKGSVSTWITPAILLLAMISCIAIAGGWSAVAWICGVVSFVAGLEPISRMAIAQKPMDSPFSPGEAFANFKQLRSGYREKYPSSGKSGNEGNDNPGGSEFDGTGGQLFGNTLLTIIVCAFTCGLAAPWMICRNYKWKIEHTVINGKRLTFTGSAGSLIGHWILWEFLSVITCFIYAFYVGTALRKWEISHTYIAGEPVLPNESYCDGKVLSYVGHKLLSILMTIFTCGIAKPWAICMMQKWDTSHQVISGRRLMFNGTGLGYFGESLIILLLSILTCGIYIPWGTVRMNKFIIRNTYFE